MGRLAIVLRRAERRLQSDLHRLREEWEHDRLRIDHQENESLTEKRFTLKIETGTYVGNGEATQDLEDMRFEWLEGRDLRIIRIEEEENACWFKSDRMSGACAFSPSAPYAGYKADAVEFLSKGFRVYLAETGLNAPERNYEWRVMTWSR